jgi:hypothetical protein
MGLIFINFRSQDEPGFAALLQRELSRSFGAKAVFYAATTIRPGDDFELSLLSGLRHSEVLIALIGPRWLTIQHPTGGRALDHETDWVRREIAEAFAGGIRVIPILVNDAERLSVATLPTDISQLARCQHLRLRYDNIDQDLARIIATLSEVDLQIRRTVVRHNRPCRIGTWSSSPDPKSGWR